MYIHTIPEGISLNEVEMIYTLYSNIKMLIHRPSTTIFIYKYILNKY